jgi:hypothetical protein
MGAGIGEGFKVGATVAFLHLHVSSTRGGNWMHSSCGIFPFTPKSSSTMHGTGGCPRKMKTASGLVTTFPSPQTEQPLDVSFDSQPHKSSIISGRNAQVTSASSPFRPACSNSPQVVEG